MTESDERLARAMGRGDNTNALAESALLSEVEEALFGTVPSPWRLGRYVVLKTVGQGGFGTVYAGYDPELDRKVAIKVLRARVNASSTDARGVALKHEAQAMAQVTHPNVAAIYDVATVGEAEAGPLAAGQLFLVMEFLDGDTLADLLDVPPSRERIKEIFIEAGRGLAAAHERGIVHLDFKPSNVMFDDEGRVRVLDFGLAQILRVQKSPDVRGEGSSGSYAGTPHYMAPEQLRGETPDARSDQYAFCVTLYQALCGQMPYLQETKESLLKAKAQGSPPLPPGLRLPVDLARVIERGLSPIANERYPSMKALVDDLGIDRRARMLRTVTIAGIGLLMLALFVIGTKLRSDYLRQCDSDPARWAGIWDVHTRSELESQLKRAGSTIGASQARATVQAFDDYVDAWSTSSRTACRETRFEGISVEHELLERQYCLERLRHEVGGLAGAATAGSPKVLAAVVRSSRDLPPPEKCLVSSKSLSPNQVGQDVEREEALAIASLVSRADALAAAGDVDTADAMARDALGRAERIEDRLGIALARRAMARTAMLKDDYERCETLGYAAMDAANEAGSDDLWVQSSNHVFTCLSRAAKKDAAETLYRMSIARIESGNVRDSAAATFAHAYGIHLLSLGKTGEARVQLEGALELLLAIYGEDHVNLGNLYNSLGNAWSRESPDLPRSLVYYNKALDLWRETWGPEHGSVGHALNNIAIIHIRGGHIRDARDTLQQVAEIYARAYDPDSPYLATVQHNQAELAIQLGEYEEGLRLIENVRVIREGRLGIDNQRSPGIGLNRGRALLGLGRVEEALSVFVHASVVARKHEMDGDHALLVYRHAVALVESNRLDESVSLVSRYELAHPGLKSAPVGRARYWLRHAIATGDSKRALKRAKEYAGVADPASVDELEAGVLMAEALTMASESKLGFEDLDALESRMEATLGDAHPSLGRALLVRAERLAQLQQHEQAQGVASRAESNLGEAVSARERSRLEPLLPPP